MSQNITELHQLFHEQAHHRINALLEWQLKQKKLH